MPTIISHAALGAATGWVLPRKYLPTRALWLGACCSAAPDLDTVGFWLGVPYDHWLGHRGFFHGLAFALLLAGLIALMARAFPAYRGSRWALFGYLAACTASHGILDAMTDGGLGIAFFAPFSNHRYFLPWRPLVVAPLDPARMLSGWGLQVILSEAFCIGIPVLLILLVRVMLGQRGRRGVPERQ
jgi:inner membrane protein